MVQLSIKSSSNVFGFSSLRNSLKSNCKTDDKFVVAVACKPNITSHKYNQLQKKLLITTRYRCM